MREPNDRRSWPSVLCGPLCALALAGCAGDDALPVDWTLRIADPSLAPAVAVVEASVLRGGCSSDDLLYRAELGPEARGPTPPALQPGRYGLAGQARDAGCRTIARGCLEVALPTPLRDAVYEVVLEAVDEGAACAENACRAGRCDGAGPRDAPDAAVPAPRDAGPTPEGDSAAPPPPPPPARDAATSSDATASPDAGARDAGTADARPPAEDASPAADTAPPPPPPPPPPPDPCRLDRCYELDAGTGTFDEARAVCTGRGGALVSFDDDDEEAFVVSLAAGSAFWIGLSDLDVEGTWVWLDGSTSSYRHWLAGEPDDAHGGEDCAMYQFDRGGWSSERCAFRRPYVCERPR